MMRLGLHSRFSAVVGLLLLALVSQSCAGRRADRRESAARYGSMPQAPERPAMSEAEMERTVHAQVNAYRRSRGLPPLAHDPVLARSARDHSRSMARRSKISHDGFRGRFRDVQPEGFVGLAENVAMNLGHDEPTRVAVRGWIRSPGHHENMVAHSRPYTGVGVARGRDGAYYFTQLFGER